MNGEHEDTAWVHGCACTESAVVPGCPVHHTAADWRGPVSRHCAGGQHAKCPGYGPVERPGVFLAVEWCGCSCGCTDRHGAAA
jgi:hypothetical protein